MIAALELTDSLITPPSVPALSLKYAQDHIRALGNVDANLVQVWIEAATSYFEEETGRQLITATREVWLDAFPFVGATGAAARIELPHPPLQSVVSVSYVDADGVLQSMTGGSPVANLFRLSAPTGDYCRRGWVEPLIGTPWPIASPQTGAVRIRYICGYGDSPDDVPALARGILCFLVAHFDTNRSAVQNFPRGESVTELPLGLTAMMAGFKYSALPSQLLRQNATTTSTTWP